MLSIGSFFDKFKNAALKEMAIRQCILDAIVKNIAITAFDGTMPTNNFGLTLKDIEIRNTVAKIRTNSSLKSQIFIKKEAILKTIRDSNLSIIITDLR